MSCQGPQHDLWLFISPTVGLRPVAYVGSRGPRMLSFGRTSFVQILQRHQSQRAHFMRLHRTVNRNKSVTAAEEKPTANGGVNAKTDYDHIGRDF